MLGFRRWRLASRKPEQPSGGRLPLLFSYGILMVYSNPATLHHTSRLRRGSTRPALGCTTRRGAVRISLLHVEDRDVKTAVGKLQDGQPDENGG